VTTRHYVNDLGIYIGGFSSESEQPKGLTEVTAPPHGLAKWVNGVWDYDTVKEWRKTAKIGRAQMCMALKRAGYISKPEAVDAARGKWPVSFNAALARHPDATEAKISWAGAGAEGVSRMDPGFIAIKDALGLTDEQADSLFPGKPA
jgi:hypothetical protein